MDRRILLPISLALLHAHAMAAAVFAPGELVRATRGEMLQADGKNFVGAAKGQEFPVLQQDTARGLIVVPFYKKDGGPVAVTISADAVEAAPHDGWLDLLASLEAFRDQRYDISRQLLARSAQDEKYRALAAALAPRLQGAIASRSTAALGTLRETATQLEKIGHPCLALALDEGVDHLGGTTAPPSKLNRADLSQRVATSTRALARTRQAVAMHCLFNAKEEIQAGLEAEPNRPELKTFQAKVEKDIAEAADRCADADRMRRIFKGMPHALTALEMGLKLCADSPQLIALKKDMSGAFEESTAPPVTPAFLTAAGGGDPKVLTEGHSLYTNRCTECHDLELIDSRTMSSWERMVGNMSRRAGLDDAQQARILAYITAAQKVVQSKPAE
ncbi:MAG: hypothetical protein P4L99_06545 [Chthoniobacter sp.]|nr:hypothetical protein [Chthoniobacter sp.]